MSGDCLHLAVGCSDVRLAHKTASVWSCEISALTRAQRGQRWSSGEGLQWERWDIGEFVTWWRGWGVGEQVHRLTDDSGGDGGGDNVDGRVETLGMTWWWKWQPWEEPQRTLTLSSLGNLGPTLTPPGPCLLHSQVGWLWPLTVNLPLPWQCRQFLVEIKQVQTHIRMDY